MKKRILSILLAAITVLAVIPLSTVIAFAVDEPTTIHSIEIEAIKPEDGVAADLTGVKIKSANGEEALSDFLGFVANKLYWAKVPSLDPSEWGSDWSKFTGTFSEGEIYSLHFALQSEAPLASTCEVTVSDPDGDVWWSGNIDSQDGIFVSADAVIEALAPGEIVSSIEITLDQEISPVTGQPTPIAQFMNVGVAVNGSDAKSSLIYDMDFVWYFNDAPFEYNEGERFASVLFRGGYYYNCELYFELDGDNVFANEVAIKVNTPSKTYEFTIDGYEDYSYCSGYIQFEEKTEGEPLKAVGDIDITVGKLTEGMRADELLINVGGENVQYVPGYDNDYNAISGYHLYNHTDDCKVDADDVIEKGKVYEIRLCIEAKLGYTLVDFFRIYDNVSINGMDPTFVEYRNLPMKEYIRVIATLPYILDNGQQITAPSMNYAGYADVANVSDVTVGVTSSALQLEAHMFPGVFEVEGDEDEYIEKHERFTLPVYLNVAPGFLVDGITKDMFIMNGTEPKFMWLDYSWSEGCPQICLLYELPVFHEHTSEWKKDATSHWNECSCGDKTNVTPHADANNDEKCDACSYDMLAIGTDPGTDPGTTPGTKPGTDPGNEPGTDPDSDKINPDKINPNSGSLFAILGVLGGGAFVTVIVAVGGVIVLAAVGVGVFLVVRLLLKKKKKPTLPTPPPNPTADAETTADIAPEDIPAPEAEPKADADADPQDAEE